MAFPLVPLVKALCSYFQVLVFWRFVPISRGFAGREPGESLRRFRIEFDEEFGFLADAYQFRLFLWVVYDDRRSVAGIGAVDALGDDDVAFSVFSVDISFHFRDPATMNRLIFALAFAAHKHRDQRRKDVAASPYINHPIALANVLANEAHVDDETALIAAILHDTIEDTDTTAEELLRDFGPEVAAIVLEVTDDKSLPKAERKRLQVVHAGEISQRAKLVKLADKICNLRDIAHSPPAGWSLERQQAYFDWARAVVDGLRGVHPELERLFDEAWKTRPPQP